MILSVHILLFIIVTIYTVMAIGSMNDKDMDTFHTNSMVLMLSMVCLVALQVFTP